MRRLIMWDIDRTLLQGSGTALRAWQAAFTQVTGVEWRSTPDFGGRTDLDVWAEVSARHGVSDSPDRFFETYVAMVHETRHEFGELGALLPGVREVLDRLGTRPDVVQTLVTGNHPRVAAMKVAAFDLTDAFDAEVGGYGTDDAVRATLVRRSMERARDKYGEDFRPVVVGDTAHDVTAALANDATAIGVATGRTTMAELVLAGAHAVLPDLSDVEASVRVILS